MKHRLLLLVPAVYTTLLLAVPAQIGAEAQIRQPASNVKKLNRTLRLPGTTTSPRPVALSVVSVDVQPPVANCIVTWHMVVRNTGTETVGGPITVRVYEKKNNGTYRAPDATLSPASLSPGQSGSASGIFYQAENYTDYTLKVVSGGQVMDSSSGPLFSIGSHQISLGDIRFEGSKCYVTIINSRPYADCGIFVGSHFANDADQSTWYPGLAFTNDIPGGGSIEQSFLLQPGFPLMRILVKDGPTLLSEKVYNIP
jgi:hypothetical protein